MKFTILAIICSLTIQIIVAKHAVNVFDPDSPEESEEFDRLEDEKDQQEELQKTLSNIKSRKKYYEKSSYQVIKDFYAHLQKNIINLLS